MILSKWTGSFRPSGNESEISARILNGRFSVEGSISETTATETRGALDKRGGLHSRLRPVGASQQAASNVQLDKRAHRTALRLSLVCEALRDAHVGTKNSALRASTPGTNDQECDAVSTSESTLTRESIFVQKGLGMIP